MQTLMPYLIFPGTCREAMDHYSHAIGAVISHVQTVGESPLPAEERHRNRIFNAELAVGGVRFRMSDDDPHHPSIAGNRMSMFATFSTAEEKRRAFDRLADGGKVLFPLGDNFGMLVDRFGVQWMVTHAEDGRG